MKLYYVCFLLFLMGCASKKPFLETPETKEMEKKLQQKVDNKNLQAFVKVASPLANNDLIRINLLPAGSSANTILLNGDDYLKFKGDSIFVDLPYFGTQQIGNGYNYGASGFRFQDVVKEYKATFNDIKKVHTIKAKTKFDKEYLNIRLEIQRNGKLYLYIKSSHRTAISYQGVVDLKE